MRTLFSLLFLMVTSFAVAQQKGYYRTPAINGNTVIFTAEGDLWKYDLITGNTSRLTTHAGMESYPAISPDGKQVVFTGQYEGITELYLMNTSGGVPKRLTYEFDGSIQASGWTNDGKILYRTRAYNQLPMPQLVKKDPLTLSNEHIPLAEASLGCYDEAGILYFTRFPNQGSKTKRYKGGFIEQIWKFDGKQEATCITADFEGTSTRPMSYQGRIYFLSDRDGTMNIWSVNTDGKDLKQHTFSKGWDIQSPSAFQSRIVFQKGADLYIYDINTNKEQLLDITLQSDFDQRKPRWIKSPLNSISASAISPNGNYIAIISRGRMFVSPAKSDRWVEVERKSGIRFRDVKFINDKSLAVLSDQNGEFEIWKYNSDGTESATQLTHNSTTQITAYEVSHDGKYIAYKDKNDVLRVLNTTNSKVEFSYDSAYGGIGSFNWSADNRFLSFTYIIRNLNEQIVVLDTHTMNTIPLTTTRLDSYNPVWTADSSWLYFISDRNFKTKVSSPWGARQPEPFYTETANIYAIPLSNAAKFPFLQKDSWISDTLFNPVTKKDMIATDDNKKKKYISHSGERIYDWEQYRKDLYQVPVNNGNLGNLTIADGYLYWLDYGGTDNNDAAKLMTLKLEESKKYQPVEVAAGVSWYTLSGNRKKLLINFNNKSIAVADANGQKPDVEKSKLELQNWNFVVDPVKDWKEMFVDAWRMMRDYFYDRDLHKVDWQAVRNRYEPLVDRLTDRYELDDLLAQMVGELSALHTFVYGGDKRVSPDQVSTGFLGASLHKSKDGLIIEHIYESDPDYPDFSSPLHKPELRIKEGDLIKAVNNIPVTEVPDIAELLANKVSIPVKLSLTDASGNYYEQVVKPISAGDDYSLRYAEWELGRRKLVDSIGKNDIGYIHLQAMGSNDMDAFVKQFYPVVDRKGLIIDVRKNNGGNIDSWILEKLMRKAWMYFQGRSGGPTWNMQYAFRGHMVILCNQTTASDGEAITEGFRRLGLGKVIGMRTWGGEIWLSSDNRMVDNGIASAAETGVFGPEGKWLIEGRGVEPDVTIDNLPFETYKGKDAQVEYAVKYLLEKIKAEPVDIPKAPAHPDKSFRYPN